MKKTSHYSIFLVALLWLSQAYISPARAGELNFGSDTEFSAQFPADSRFGIGAASKVSIDGGSVIVHAEVSPGEKDAPWYAIYSDARDDLDFLSKDVVVTFTDVLFTTGEGGTYACQFGIFSQAGGGNGNVTSSGGPLSGVYFHLNRYTNVLSLIQKIKGSAHTLAEWKLSGASPGTLVLTLRPDSWVVEGVDTKGSSIDNGNAKGDFIGTYNTPISGDNWGDHFHIGLESQVTGVNSGRRAELSVGNIVIAAKPDSVSTSPRKGPIAMVAQMPL